MFERFTARARRVIVLAQEEAKRLNHRAVDPEHILLGIIREGEGVGFKVLESLSISPDRVRTEIVSAFGPDKHERDFYQEVAFTKRAKKVLDLALDEARRFRHNYIGTEHLLLGLIREANGGVARVLGTVGADLEHVRAQVVYLLREEGMNVAAVARKHKETREHEEDRKYYEQLRRATVRTTSRVWAEVDLDALAANVRAVSAFVKPAALMAVVKADAYGHGAIGISRIALEAGATCLGVATVEEGLALRWDGVQAPILILGSIDRGDVPNALRHELDLTLGSVEALEAWGTIVASSPSARVHLKIDTGMTRLGVLPEQVPDVLSRLKQLKIPLFGCCTHLACADDPNPAFTREQLARFTRILAEVRSQHPRVLVHAANSAAAIAYPESRFDIVRVGLAIYGLSPASHLNASVSLRPAMTLRSRVVRVSHLDAGGSVSYGATYRASAPTTIATIACGYGDGYPRLTNGRSAVLIRGRRAPIVGRVTMDYMMVDVGKAPVAIGDEAVLFGQQLTAEEVASWAQTISYEILCRVSPRVPRVYLREGREVSPGSER